jgi:ubiquinone/menaquinone biosynthesis C-methylase UbiE
MKTIIRAEPKGKTCPPRHIPLSEKMTASKLQIAYDEIADQYEKKVSKASCKILDVACGTGLNIPFFPAGSDITAVDLSPKMLEVTRANAAKHGLNVNLAVIDAEHLEFADGSFDTVVSTLSTCTFPDPFKALQEMKRVCRPNGLILLLEHGHSSVPWLANFQDRNEYKHFQEHVGCRWNQDPLDLVQAAGIRVLKNKRSILGMFHSVEATPAG